jgi:hypothetical protein
MHIVPEAGVAVSGTPRWPDRFRARLQPQALRGIVSKRVDGIYRIRSVPNLDQGPQSIKHRGAAGAQREVEQVMTGPRAAMGRSGTRLCGGR